MMYIHNNSNFTILTLPRRMSLFNILKTLYTNRKFPTPNELYHEFLIDDQKNETPIDISLKDFLFEINLLDLVYRKVPSSKFLVMEYPEQAFARSLYLKKIKKLRECKGTQFYYLDVRLIDNTYAVKKLKTFMSHDTRVLDHYIFYHLISSEGYVHGLFSNIFTIEIYNKWMTDTVLKKIKPSSVIVLNNKILTYSETPTITRLSSKKSMIKYLKDISIPCNEDMLKAELYELITRHPQSKSESSIERIFKAEGHEILQLPSSIDILSATEKMWDAIRTKLKNESIAGVRHKKDFIINTINEVNNDTWVSWNEEIADMENEISELDLGIELAFEKYLKD